MDAVVHLAGASIGGRFTEENKREILTSRTGPTRALAMLAARSPGGPRTFVTASAVGFYGADRGDEVLTENSERGDGFLADVAAAWEDATAPATAAGIRTVQVRTGIVQTPRGGMLRLLYPLFEAGLGGPLGDGTGWQPWIEIDDLLDIYLRAVTDPALAGPVNAVAPGEARNAEYARTLGRVLRRPALIPVPPFGPQLLLGAEGARELAAASQRVRPAALAAAGHVFRYPHLEGAPAARPWPPPLPRWPAAGTHPGRSRLRIGPDAERRIRPVSGRKIAVIGGGISGLTAAYILARTDEVTVFEAGDRLGGHADTHLVPEPGGPRYPWTRGSSSTTSARTRC